MFDGLDELRSAVGTKIGYSGWHLVTQEQIDRFAQATGDLQWIHVDPERAADGPFGRTIAHGYLTLSMVPRLTRDIYRIEGLKMGVNYGADKVRFPSPVLVDTAVRVGVEFTSLTEVPAGFQLASTVTVEIAENPKPACVAQTLTLLVPAI